MSGDRHNSNAELVAQGLANMAVPLVGGIPVTGAIARTATNYRSGARTPVAGIVHALTLLAVRAPCGAAGAITCRWRRSLRCCSSSPTTWASGARSRTSCGSTSPTCRCG